MSSIVDALKTVHPEATGDTIAEVIKTMEAGGGSGGGAGNVITVTVSGTISSSNKPTVENISHTFAEARELVESGNPITFAFIHPKYEAMPNKYHKIIAYSTAYCYWSSEFSGESSPLSEHFEVYIQNFHTTKFTFTWASNGISSFAS